MPKCHRGGTLITMSAVRLRALLVGAAATLVGVGEARAQMRSVTTEVHLLTLDGATVGPLSGVEGGAITGNVVVIQAGGDADVAKKHIAGLRYEDIIVDVGPGMSKALSDWIAGSWAGTSPRKNGSVVTGDAMGKARTEREFNNALLTATTFPTLDAASKEPASLRLAITPELIRVKSGGGADVKGAVGSKAAGKAWLASNFKLELDGLDATHVTRIESFTVRQPIAAYAAGERREHATVPGKVEFPNLRITLRESSADSWIKWHEDFVTNGNSGDDREKNGAIVVLGPDLKRELFRVNLQNCGIFRLARERVQAGAEKVANLTADLYCERMQFTPMADGLALRGRTTADGPREGI